LKSVYAYPSDNLIKIENEPKLDAEKGGLIMRIFADIELQAGLPLS
jgi:hypothetical protein